MNQELALNNIESRSGLDTCYRLDSLKEKILSQKFEAFLSFLVLSLQGCGFIYVAIPLICSVHILAGAAGLSLLALGVASIAMGVFVVSASCGYGIDFAAKICSEM